MLDVCGKLKLILTVFIFVLCLFCGSPPQKLCVSVLGRRRGQHRWRGFCECGSELSGSKNEGNFLTNLGPVSFSGRALLRVVCSFVRSLVS